MMASKRTYTQREYVKESIAQRNYMRDKMSIYLSTLQSALLAFRQGRPYMARSLIEKCLKEQGKFPSEEVQMHPKDWLIFSQEDKVQTIDEARIVADRYIDNRIKIANAKRNQKGKNNE